MCLCICMYIYAEMEILREEQKEILQIKNTATEMKNACVGLLVRGTQLGKKNSQDSGCYNNNLQIIKENKTKQKTISKNHGTTITDVMYRNRNIRRGKNTRMEGSGQAGFLELLALQRGKQEHKDHFAEDNCQRQ